MQKLTRALAMLVLTVSLAAAEPLGTAFTYQGHLSENGLPAAGWYSFRFTLWDAANGGQRLAEPLFEERAAVSNGWFTVALDFGANELGLSYFRGSARWLEIGVDHAKGTNFTTLEPRQPLTPTPYALYATAAGSVPATGLSGTLPDARLSGNVARLDSSPAFAGSVTAGNELAAPKLQIGLFSQAGTSLATIAGGLRNTNLGSQSFLGQGMTNTIQTNTGWAFLGGGRGNLIESGADYAFLGGGYENTLKAGVQYATVGGGLHNTNGGKYATVPGGRANAALGDYSFAAGFQAKAEHPGAFVWADSSAGMFHSSQDNQFAVRAHGGLYVEGSGGFAAPQLHLRQTDSGGWARLRFSVDGVSNLWNISMQPHSSPDLRFSNLTNSISFGVDGRITADAFKGDGSQLTGLNAAAIIAGTLPEAQLPANVARLDSMQTFTGWKTFAHLTASDKSGPLGSGGSIRVGSSAGTADPKLIKFGDGSGVTIGEDGEDDRMQLKAAVFAFLPSTGTGHIGIGKTNPATALDVNGTVTATGFQGAAGAKLTLAATSGTTGIKLDGGTGGTNGGGWMRLYKGDGTPGMILTAQDAAGDSCLTTQVIEITGGSDLSERFDLTPAPLPPQPGMLVCIDPDRPGQLAVSAHAYDRTVAGVISGAGGIKPGMLMSQHGSVASGQHPIALTGRTYCLVDADAAGIKPGDLITTSDTPGHGMKASDHARAQGAIIGKAMTALEKGRGLVLVLVSLQ